MPSASLADEVRPARGSTIGTGSLPGELSVDEFPVDAQNSIRVGCLMLVCADRGSGTAPLAVSLNERGLNPGVSGHQKGRGSKVLTSRSRWVLSGADACLLVVSMIGPVTAISGQCLRHDHEHAAVMGSGGGGAVFLPLHSFLRLPPSRCWRGWWQGGVVL